MTIEEAAATLGLASNELAPAAVEQNYRRKAKHCHPDRASYPGAAADFKRATEAFNRLKQPAAWPVTGNNPQGSSEVAEAAEGFLFSTALAFGEPWLWMSWTERLGRLMGTHELRVLEAGVAKQNTPLARVAGKKGNALPRPLLITPVDAEVLEVGRVNSCRVWLLRPLETDQVRRRLQRSVDGGLDLGAAVERLRDDLFDASRSLLTC